MSMELERTGERTPRRYTDADKQAVIDAVAKGLPHRSAAALVAMPEKSFEQLMRTDDEFAEAVLIAEGQAQMTLLEACLDGVRKNPKLALEILRARFPGEWAERRSVQVTGAVGHALVTPANMMQLAKVRRELDQIEVQEPEFQQVSESPQEFPE